MDQANAALVVLARNSELEGISLGSDSGWNDISIDGLTPYVFLNDEEFNSTFRQDARKLTNANIEFGLIDQKDWNFPEWADPSIQEGIASQGNEQLCMEA